MRPEAGSIPNAILLSGQVAHDCLTSGQRGRILAAVSDSIYLLMEDELIWLTIAGAPMHRRGMQARSNLPCLAAGSGFTVQDQWIEFESGAKLDLHSAQSWESPTLPAGEEIEAEEFPERLLSFLDAFLAGRTSKGFGSLILPMFKIEEEQEVFPEGVQESPILLSAWPLVAGIARACRQHDLPGVLRQAEALTGLGEGLTPSGDDFLGGLFFARYLLACHYPQHTYLDFPLPTKRIEAFRGRTNLISFTILEDNALGHAPEPLAHLGVAFLKNQAPDLSIPAAAELTALGHSTGWDMLAGFLAGLRLMLT